MVSNLFIDSKGNFWIGTWSGICKFDGTRFEEYPIPYPKVETKINQDTKDWITSIAEDSKGTFGSEETVTELVNLPEIRLFILPQKKV